MKRTRDQCRRGAALILVLAVVALTVVALAPLAQLSALTVRDRRDRAMRLRADDALLASQMPILRWLNEHSRRVVLPPECTSPRVVVLNDQWTAGGAKQRMTIMAFDQCGMVPWQLVGVDRVLSFTLPEGVPPPDPKWVRGVDQMALGESGRAFPGSASSSDRAFGELVATHNPPPGTGERAPVININTAPMDLVAAAMLSAGYGEPNAVRESRERGRRAGATIRTTGAPTQLVLAQSSNSWAFRVDIEVGSVSRAWWVIYCDRGSSWERVQQLAITE